MQLQIYIQLRILQKYDFLEIHVFQLKTQTFWRRYLDDDDKAFCAFPAELKNQPSELDKNEGFAEEKLNKKKNTFDNIIKGNLISNKDRLSQKSPQSNKKISLKLEKLDILKKTKSVGIAVSKTKIWLIV